MSTGDRPEVPDAIAVVRDFVNTTDRETDTDELTTAPPGPLPRHRRAALGPARAAGGPGPRPPGCVRGCAGPAELNHDGSDRSLDSLDQALPTPKCRWRCRGREGRPALRPTEAGVRGALAQIGLAAHDAATADIWWRLKICAYDECEWACYDHSKNRSRSYCEYGCGNKLKTRAYRARRQPRPAGARRVYAGAGVRARPGRP